MARRCLECSIQGIRICRRRSCDEGSPFGGPSLWFRSEPAVLPHRTSYVHGVDLEAVPACKLDGDVHPLGRLRLGNALPQAAGRRLALAGTCRMPSLTCQHLSLWSRAPFVCGRINTMAIWHHSTTRRLPEGPPRVLWNQAPSLRAEMRTPRRAPARSSSPSAPKTKRGWSLSVGGPRADDVLLRLLAPQPHTTLQSCRSLPSILYGVPHSAGMLLIHLLIYAGKCPASQNLEGPSVHVGQVAGRKKGQRALSLTSKVLVGWTGFEPATP